MDKRYLILGIGYNHVAVPYTSGQELAALMGALADAKHVSSTGYGDEQKWTPSSSDPLQMQLVEGARVTVGDDLATLKALLAEQTRSAEQNSKYWMASNAKVAALEKQLKDMSIKPAPAPEPATADDDQVF
jgi:hypothetical protein